MQQHIITPYVGVGPLKFGMTRADAHKILGAPLSSKKSRFSDESKDFWDENGLQLTFSGGDEKLLEISLYPNLPDVELNGLKLFTVPGADAFKALSALDTAPLTRAGTTIFLKLGLAVGGFLHSDESDKSVTAFAKGRWDE